MAPIADRIFCLLKVRGIEQKEFAQKIGVSDKTVSAWKTSRAKSYTKYLTKIAETLSVPVEYLLQGGDRPELCGQLPERDKGTVVEKWRGEKRGVPNPKFPYTMPVCGRLEYEYSIGADSVIGSCKIPPEYIQELEHLIEKMLKAPQNQL